MRALFVVPFLIGSAIVVTGCGGGAKSGETFSRTTNQKTGQGFTSFNKGGILKVTDPQGRKFECSGEGDREKFGKGEVGKLRVIALGGTLRALRVLRNCYERYDARAQKPCALANLCPSCFGTRTMARRRGFKRHFAAWQPGGRCASSCSWPFANREHARPFVGGGVLGAMPR